jgi:hypothetical protein
MKHGSLIKFFKNIKIWKFAYKLVEFLVSKGEIFTFLNQILILFYQKI